MALSLVNQDAGERLVTFDWPAIQHEQFVHDERYHPEISRLPMQARLRHMALHFAKYAGRLHDAPSEEEFKRLATDSLIIAVSCANSLNIDLTEVEMPILPVGRMEFVNRLTVCAGRMSGACEKLDHLEDFPFRSSIVDQVLQIIPSALGLFEAEGWAPVDVMRDRLAPVKAKKLFHGKH